MYTMMMMPLTLDHGDVAPITKHALAEHNTERLLGGTYDDACIIVGKIT